MSVKKIDSKYRGSYINEKTKNPLSYTSLTPSICDESINVPMGHTCFSDSTIKILEKNKKEILGDPINYKDKPIIAYFENIPTDGSKNTKVITDYIKVLDVLSEYDLLENEKVKKLLGKELVRSEKERFKLPGDRYFIRGTDGNDCYNVLKRWSKVFKFFKPIEHEECCDDSKVILKAKDIVNMFRNNSKIKALGGIFTISTLDEEDVTGCGGGWHAMSIFIDIRSNNEWSVEYFDSSGSPPVLRYIELMNSIVKELRTLPDAPENIEYHAVTQRLIHQYTPAECGMLSLIFIRRRLEGIPRIEFAKNIIPPSFAIDFRRFVFGN